MLTSSMYSPVKNTSMCVIGRGNLFPTRLNTSYRYNFNCTRAVKASRKNTFSSISCLGSHAQCGGLHYKWATGSAEFLWLTEEKEEEEEEERAKGIYKIGDVVNISQLLFTKDRDYLIKSNDSQLVMSEHLAGKVIVMYFVPLRPDCFSVEEFTNSLIDTYNDLKFMNCFEVVLVVVDDVTSFDKELGKLCPDPSLLGEFEHLFSQMPWVAIPFSDITSRKLLKRKFCHSRKLFEPKEVLIDSEGMILHTFPQSLFQIYGSLAYPFTDERIAFLKAEDENTTRQPSLKALLGTAERDYVISNKGDKVPIHTLENKVVALLFYEGGYMPCFVIRQLKKYYNELAKNNQNFEVVLLYLYDTFFTRCTNEEAFWYTFETMPWLALPYKDPAHKKLKRLFSYPYLRQIGNDPSLVIVGPHKKIIDPGAIAVLKGYDANLLTREVFARLEAQRDRELNLKMLCGPETVFRRKNGSQVRFSQLAGKRIIFLFEGEYPKYDGAYFLKNLKDRYMQMKGTADEFEVIYFPNNKDKCCHGKRVADVPWLVSRVSELLPGGGSFLSFYWKCYNRYKSSFLLAFGRDGSLVRRTICPVFGDTGFPFYVEGVEIEAFDIGYSNFCWGYWDTLYQGLLRHSSDQINIPSGDLLFSVYSY